MNNTQTIIKEFKKTSELYQDYGLAVKNLLESLLKKNHYKYQLNQRLKDVESLKEKIKRKRRLGKIYKKLGDIEDIMGLRVVFYTEIDRKKFIKDLTKAFGKTLRVKETTKVSGYRSTHVILTFGSNRTKLEEYKRFKGLKCEVQMTLILNHAWAEVEHDIFYKETSRIKKMDKKKYHTFKRRMEKVMFDHIQKASIGLENVIKNVKRLEETPKEKSVLI